MAVKRMIARIRIRGGTYIQWYNANPILEEREISFVVSGQDAGKFKVGDGVTDWRALPYTAARFPEDILQLADQVASSALPDNGDIKQLFQAIRNYLKWETSTRQSADTALQQADADLHGRINDEAQARVDGDFATLIQAKNYTDTMILTTHTWLPSVSQKSSLDLITGLTNNLNYLCRVIADPDPANNGVYQAVAGWANSPVWTFFSDNQDWIDELELAAAIAKTQSKVVPATCATAAATVAKVVSISGYTLTSGDILAITYTNGNTANAATVNVNGAGAKQVRLGGGQPTGASGTGAHYVAAGNTVLYYYNGTYMCQLGSTDITDADGSSLSGTFAPLSHASTADTYGIAEDDKYGHVRFPTPAAAANVPKSAFPYTYVGGSTVTNLNDYRDAGIYVFYQPASTSLNFPLGWGYGSSNAAILEVIPFYQNTAVKQILHKRGTNQTYVRYSTSASAWSSDGYDWELISGHRVGDLYIQYPNMKEPKALGFEGTWAEWNSRVEIYGTSLTIPSYASYNGGYDIQAGNYYRVTHDDGDQEIFQALVNIPFTEIAQNPFNPAKWRPLSQSPTSSHRPTFVPRNSLQQELWTASDLAIGASTNSNGTTYYVTARHGLGGKFLSMSGGNRPAFTSGGVKRDEIRNIIGDFGNVSLTSVLATGAFSAARTGAGQDYWNNTDNSPKYKVTIDSSLVVPTGRENAPRTMSLKYWRRVS